jgi:hypothetical protein
MSSIGASAASVLYSMIISAVDLVIANRLLQFVASQKYFLVCMALFSRYIVARAAGYCEDESLARGGDCRISMHNDTAHLSCHSHICER